MLAPSLQTPGPMQKYQPHRRTSGSTQKQVTRAAYDRDSRLPLLMFARTRSRLRVSWRRAVLQAHHAATRATAGPRPSPRRESAISTREGRRRRKLCAVRRSLSSRCLCRLTITRSWERPVALEPPLARSREARISPAARQREGHGSGGRSKLRERRARPAQRPAPAQGTRRRARRWVPTVGVDI